ncbi:uncharacterized protein EV420DRAFT_1565972 [Desarmillaria tabescens]|uniref:Uncharacterized protein n=1 Tax=Armillaria tabescens TaxID=1929756 RepID=A0AA39JUP3_ARMTA|nr:uncharacterized protein EV420DRAFT_1565972 [Desarmillaria tabescens]KAK0448887.1 hypothetical protein EV420DRAFT_1565972 [Desarmillaria tabescens]
MFRDIVMTNPEKIKHYHDICLASPIIPAAARSVSFMTLNIPAIQSPLIPSILRLTTSIDTIQFVNVHWDKLPQEVLDIVSSYPLTKILLNNVVIPSALPFFSFFRRCATRVPVDLHISGMLRLESAAEEQAADGVSPDKPIAVRSLIIRCPDPARKALRAILLSPSSPFNLRILTNTVFTMIGYDIGTDRNAILLRDIISSPNMSRSMRSRFIMQEPPSFMLHIPSTIQRLSFAITGSPLQVLAFRPSSILRWWIDGLLRSKCYCLEQLNVLTSLLLDVWIIDDEALDAWAHLDEELSSPSYEVKVMCIGIGHQGLLDDPVRYAEVVNTLTKCMPGLAKKDALKLICDPEPSPRKPEAGAA